MKSFYSILKFVNNELSDESINIGIVMKLGDKVHFKLSARKFDFAKKLDAKKTKLADFTITQIKNFFYKDSLNENLPLGINREVFGKVNENFLNRLSLYNNGIVQFTAPQYINAISNDNILDTYFSKLIDSESESSLLQKEKINSIKSDFEKKIERKIHKPLRNTVDVDITIKANQLPSLYFDYHLDSIGVNGALYATKAIDFSSKENSIPKLRSEISEYESLIDRLDILAKRNNISENGQYYLVVDPYDGKSHTIREIYSILDSQNVKFNMITTLEVEDVVRLIKANNAKKITETLLLDLE